MVRLQRTSINDELDFIKLGQSTGYHFFSGLIDSAEPILIGSSESVAGQIGLTLNVDTRFIDRRDKNFLDIMKDAGGLFMAVYFIGNCCLYSLAKQSLSEYLVHKVYRTEEPWRQKTSRNTIEDQEFKKTLGILDFSKLMDTV